MSSSVSHDVSQAHRYPDVVLYHLRFDLKLENGREYLPAYLGSTFRGIIAASFRNLVCLTQAPVCKGCEFLNYCAYPYMFETLAPVDLPKPLRRRFHQAPRPYILDLPRVYRGEAMLTLGITLVGRAIDYLPYLIYVIQQAGQNKGLGKSQVPYRLTRVTDYGTQNGNVIFNAERGMLSADVEPITLSDLHEPSDAGTEELSLEFITPLRIKKYGAIQENARRIDFSVLIDLLLRRLQALSLFHCGREWAPNNIPCEVAREVQVSATDLRLQKLQRYSARQQRKLPLDGLVGTITFRGSIGQFLPLIKMGSFVHVGAGTAFGLGRYHLKQPSLQQSRDDYGKQIYA
jgi:hypothetical protein